MPKRKTDMEKVREILRLYLNLKYSLRDTSIALGVSKTTVGEYLAEFKRTGLTYPGFLLRIHTMGGGGIQSGLVRSQRPKEI